MAETTRQLVSDLDGQIGGILCNLETLEDIKDNLGVACQDLETANLKDINVLHFIDLYRTTRLLDTLLRYTVDELSENVDTIKGTINELFNRLVKEQKEEE